MIIIGLILIAAAVVFGVDMLAENNISIPEPSIFGQSLGTTSGRSFFVLGAIVGAAIILGIGLLLAGLRRKGSKAVGRHKERKQTDRTEDDRDSLRSDNADLRRQLDERPVEVTRPATERADTEDLPGATRNDR